MFCDYCDEQLSPIYGYVDKAKVRIAPKYGSSKALFINFHKEEKKAENEEKKYNTFCDFSKEVNKNNEKGKVTIETIQNEKIEMKKEHEDYSASWKEVLRSCSEKQKVSIQEFTEEYVADLIRYSQNEKVVLVFENKGELGYASNMLYKLGIAHSYDIRKNVALILTTMDAVSNDYQGSTFVLASAVFKREYSTNIAAFVHVLQNAKDFKLLDMRNKNFVECEMENGEKRWVLTNVYGATHIQMNSSDLLIEATKDEIELLLVDNMNGEYDVIDVDNGEKIGKSAPELITALNDLLFEGQIFGLPDKVENIRLQKINDEYCVLGLGHMIFVGY